MSLEVQRIANLLTLVREFDDEEAGAQLAGLLEADAEAREIYLRLVWLETQFAHSSTLLRNRNHAIRDAASAEPWIDLNHDSEFAQNDSARSSVGVRVASEPKRLNTEGWTRRVAVMVGVAAVAALLTLVTKFFQENDEPKKLAVTAEKPTVKISQQERRQLVAGGIENNLAHPPRGGKIPGGVPVSEDPIPDEISFNFHVRAILSENCFFCHGPDANHREADLRLDTREGYLDAVEPGKPEESELLARIYELDEDTLMPPPHSGRALSARQKEILKRWIEQGAKFEEHWAFQPPQKPAIPAVEQSTWPRNPIDHFVLSELERRQIKPSPRARPEVLIRRMYLDLIGLPPAANDIERFCSAYSNDPDQALSDLADALLDNHHYGERMALPWLDAARYADSNGFQQDGDRSQWPWRDWVIESINRNMPFDQFTLEQLAGDLLPNPSRSQVIATAFNRNHMLNGEGGAIAEEQRNNYVFDRVDTTATTWLGMTMACAQCHDHKYDPITQKDYYRFFAFFNTIDERGGVDRRVGRQQSAQPYVEFPTEDQQKIIANIDSDLRPIRKLFADLDEEIVAAMRIWEEQAKKEPAPKNMGRDIFNLLVKSPNERGAGGDKRLKDWYLQNVAKQEWRELKKKESQLVGQRNKEKAKVLTVMVMKEQAKPRSSFVLERGNYEDRGEEVSPGVPEFLAALDADEPSRAVTRLDLAKWLVSKENPLTSRVQVNRYWQTFFGIGLVKTAEDFGVQGELPSHPELLDWLAVDFRESGWDVKRIHKMIVTSETYLQNSKARGDLKDIDPENRLLARSPRFRLSSPLIRDSALTVSGLLNRKLGGAPVYPYQPSGLWREFSLEKFGYTTSTGNDLYRRSLYTFWRRTVAPPNMFDSSNRQTCTVKLSRTNTPLQALTLLNDPTYVEAACHLAQDLIDENDTQETDGSVWLSKAFVRALGREPKQPELQSLRSAFEESREFFANDLESAKQYCSAGAAIKIPKGEPAIVELAALASVCQIILNTDEFMTRE